MTTMTLSLPLFNRSTDTRTDCWARWFLEKFYEDDIPDAAWFFLGTGLHHAIEMAITEDVSLEEMIEIAINQIADAIHANATTIMWSKKRPEEKWPEVVRELCEKWWSDVHPTSEKRMKRYNEFQWPPEVEFEIYVGDLHTTVDAIFTSNDGSFEAIVDWKTGSTAKAQDLQLWVYAYGLGEMEERPEELWKGHNPMYREMWFHHVAFSKLQEAKEYPGDEVIALILEATTQKKLSEIYEPNPDWYCNYCRVQDKCPVFGGEIRPLIRPSVRWVSSPGEYYG